MNDASYAASDRGWLSYLPAWVRDSRIRYSRIIAISLIHLLAIGAIFTFSWWGLLAFAVMSWATACLGITLCYHRLLTHKSYRTPKPVKYFLTFCGCQALQGGPIRWVANHRLHHKESDDEPDPHTPFVSFLWSHCLWLFFSYPEPDLDQRYAKDLLQDPAMRFFQRWYFPLYLAFAGLLFLAGWLAGGLYLGLSLLFWGVFLRTVYVWHVTWFVNSATHLWGYRNYKTTDNSRNTWWVGLLAFGEGWHNNHHADQRSAQHGHRWWEIDVTYWTIKTMAAFGLARDIVLPQFKRLKDKAATAALKQKLEPVPVKASSSTSEYLHNKSA